MTRFEPAQGLDEMLAATVARRAVDRYTTMVADLAREKAPAAKVWVTANDERVRPTHRDADGQIVPENLRYVLDKPPRRRGESSQETELARAPRDESLSSGNRINCRCVSTSVPGVIASSIRTTDTVVEGTRARAEVETRFPRIIECEYAGEPDHPVRFMSGAVDQVARTVRGRARGT